MKKLSRSVADQIVANSRLRLWREVSLFALLVMELSWIIPWYRSLTPLTYSSSPQRVFIVLGGIIFLSLISSRVFYSFKIKTKYQQIGIGFLLVVSILVGVKTLIYPTESIPLFQLIVKPIKEIVNLKNLIPNEFLITAIVIVAFLRGLLLARIRIGPKDVLSKFQFGFFMLLLFIMINSLVTEEGIGNFYYLFLFAGLLAMGAARISVLVHLRGGNQYPFDRNWVVGILISVVGLVGIGATLNNLLLGESSVIGGVLSALVGIILVILVLAITPIVILGSYVAIQSIEWLENNGVKDSVLLSSLTESINELWSNLLQLAEFLFEFLEKLGILKLLGWIPNLKPIILLLILSIITLIAVWVVTLNIIQARKKLNLIENRAWLKGSNGFVGYIRKMFGDAILSWGNRFEEISSRSRIWASARIRRIYTKLLGLIKIAGFPKLEAETPLEYAKKLEVLFPALGADFNIITLAYLEVRYGGVAENPGIVKDVEDAWKRILSRKELFANPDNQPKN